MTELAVALGAFHFIRPSLLVAVPIIVLLWWLIRKSATRQTTPQSGLPPHLRDALTVGNSRRRWFTPIDGVALALLLAALASAGPTWSRVPDPFVAQSAPVVVILEVTSSMEDIDLAPSRLERGKQKIRDFLDLRAGARTALVAYAGSAHGVVPMTEDPGVVLPYLEGLNPDVMPKEGQVAAQALTTAQQILAEQKTPGGILFVTDGIDPADVGALDDAQQTLVVLAMLPEGIDDRGLDALTRPVVTATPDSSDLKHVESQLNAAYRQAMLENSEQPWLDRGVWLAWPLALLILFWFRKGWTMRWAAFVVFSVGLGVPQPGHADDIADWFFTADQQGQIAFNRKNFGTAGDLFADPLWRGYAQYKAGQYDEAVTTLERLETAQAAFIQGMAQVKSRQYRPAVRSFELALQLDPEFPNAQENLETAQRIVEYVETAREQSDTGEETGIGADDVVFDNEAARGADTELDEKSEEAGTALLTSEQWMNTVDTRTGDFLRQRFAIEASQRSQGSKPATSDAENSE
jgi:Ca-activated chloride channel homolog